MNAYLDQEKLKIPAFMRKKAIVRQAKQRLILTALDRKLAGLDVHSKKALSPIYSGATNSSQNIKNPKRPVYSGETGLTGFDKLDRRQKIRQRQKDIGINRTSVISNNLPIISGFCLIKPIGAVTDYYDKIQVAVIKLSAPLHIGDIIQIEAGGMLFQQPVESMQINRKPVKIAKKGADIGLKVFHQPKNGGIVYKVVEEKFAGVYRKNIKIKSKNFDQPVI